MEVEEFRIPKKRQYNHVLMLNSIKQTNKTLQQTVEEQNEQELNMKLYNIHNELYNISWYNRHQHPDSTTSMDNRITDEKYIVKSYAHRQNSVFFNTSVNKNDNDSGVKEGDEDDSSFFNILFQ